LSKASRAVGKALGRDAKTVLGFLQHLINAISTFDFLL
jgi:hypothetical protein